MALNKVVLILGSGKNIGSSTAAHFLKHGYSVAIASRSLKPGRSEEGYHRFNFDASEPSTVKQLFEEVKKSIGIPSVVVYNAPSSIFVPPFEIPTADFQRSLTINVVSPHAAASEALASLEQLKAAGSDLTFIYTGNGLNAVPPIAKFLALGVGKTASAYWIQVGAQEYAEKGAKFYYVDERGDTGAFPSPYVDGEAHAIEFLKLAGDKEQNEVIYTFVKGKGYVKF
ncbi:putative short-chain dehydrogenase [Meredithblackwellia eburnea MCA 4105]